MEPLYLIIVLTGALLIFLSGRGDRRSSISRRSQNWRIEQLERKVDLLLKHSELEIETNHLTLIEVPPVQKIAAIKVVRELTGLGLKDAKDLVESAPVSLEHLVIDPIFAKQKLEEAGAIVILRRLP
ncbi:ribosomal protein L7/L12 [Tumidithrix elongata RA019]|uniref:Ribosomal protein L7/L12 n=1 Tax=Tumidithrix elongata BACA0141 TaxID=2716417 RepID=A0AAW9Q0D7_9CYAN|nr:ribosomal protein L7/L12 [Tumidithrix elongata RA019]